MSCLINSYGKISNLHDLINYLKVYVDDETDTNESYLTHANKTLTTNWIDLFKISISPCGNLLVVAYKKQFLILQAKWETNNQIKYSISSKISINSIETSQNEFITSVICIPIASQKKSGEGLIEWTCIIIGTSIGNTKIYTENGTLLLSQMFHDDSVISIKCRTKEQTRYSGWIDQPEEVQILYSNNVLVCLDGVNFYHYLKAARIYAAKASHILKDFVVPGATLDYKKWHLDSQTLLNDFVSAGVTSENRFDQLFAASFVGGPQELFRARPPTASRYITCGNEPFVGFYSDIEGLPSNIEEVAKVVAGTVKNAFMNVARGWIGFKKSEDTSKPKPKIEAPTKLPARFSIPDLRRSGESIIVAPGNNLAATTDSFARVILIDINKGIAIRVFKGYRDAQIGWLTVDDENDDKSVKRYALYLVIYATRRGLLEIWGCQQGVRVAAFNIGKNCRLFYPGYSMLSLNGVLLNGQDKLIKKPQCFILDSNGQIKILEIPFHLILNDKSNQRVRDGILLKKLKNMLKNATTESDNMWKEIRHTLNDFKTALIKEQAIEKILHTSYLSPIKIKDILSDLYNDLKKQGDNINLDVQKLKTFIKYNSKLVDSFVFILDCFNSIDKSAELLHNCDEDLLRDLNNLLKIEESYLKDLIVNEKSQTLNFKNEAVFQLQDFLSCFEISNINGEEFKILIKPEFAIKDKMKLGLFLFSNWFRYTFNDVILDSIIDIIPLQRTQLLELLLFGWLNQDKIIFKNIRIFIDLIERLSNYRDNPDDFELDFIPKMIFHLESSESLNCAFIIVAIFQSISKEQNYLPKTIQDLKVLQDRLLSLIQIKRLLSIGNDSVLKSLDFEFSVRNILNKGRNIISDLVAKHIVLNEFPFSILSEHDNEKVSSITECNKIYREFNEQLKKSRQFMSKSLELDTLLVYCGWKAIKMFDANLDLIKWFDNSLKYCANIDNATIKEGITNMIWHEFICKRIAALTNLIEKVGKAPKDRLCRKDVGIPEAEMMKFLEDTLFLLEIMMDANCNLNEVPIFNNDKFWLIENNSQLNEDLINQSLNDPLKPTSLANDTKSLSEKSAEQKHINYHLCLFHTQLVRVLLFIIKFNIKTIRPLSLYDTKCKRALFSDLHTHPLISNDPDITVIQARKAFFTKVINSLTESIQPAEDVASKLPQDIHENFDTILNLCKDMNLDIEYVKRYYCSILYGIEYYTEGEKILLTIKERNQIANELLIVIGHKVNYMLKDNFNVNTYAILPTNVSSWLKSIEKPDYKITEAKSKQNLIELLGNLIKDFDEENDYDLKLASELLDFLNSI